MNYYIYILTNKNKTTLYIGVTNNLTRRLFEHQNIYKGFVKRYNCNNLIYYERFCSILTAIAREKQLKKWNRTKKEKLISSANPDWTFITIDDLL